MIDWLLINIKYKDEHSNSFLAPIKFYFTQSQPSHFEFTEVSRIEEQSCQAQEFE
jgi:hypothetical protein